MTTAAIQPARAVSVRRRIALSLLGGALLLASCAQTPKRVAVAPPPKAAEQPPPQPQPAPPPRPIERVAIAPPQHNVALLVPLTGDNAPIGQSIANAANLALLDRNTQRIKLKVYNTTSGAAIAADQAVRDGADIILGPFLASDTRVVAPIARAGNIPVLSFSNDVSLAGSGVFVMGYMPDQEVARVVAFASRQGAKRFAALVPNDTYGGRVSRAFADAVKRMDGQLVAIQSYPRDRSKLAAAARRVAQYDERLAKARAAVQSDDGGVVRSASANLPPPNFDVLLIAEAGSFTRGFLPALRTFGVSAAQVRFIGPGLWSTDPGLAREPGLQGAWFAAVPDATYQQVAERLRQRFGLNASRFASMGYDAMLLAYIADAKGWKIGEPFPTAVITDRGGYTGVDGLFRFRPSGVSERGLEVRELRQGRFVTVDAAPRTFGGEADSAVN